MTTNQAGSQTEGFCEGCDQDATGDGAYTECGFSGGALLCTDCFHRHLDECGICARLVAQAGDW